MFSCLKIHQVVRVMVGHKEMFSCFETEFAAFILVLWSFYAIFRLTDFLSAKPG